MRCRLSAPLGHARLSRACPFSGVDRKSPRSGQTDADDPLLPPHSRSHLEPRPEIEVLSTHSGWSSHERHYHCQSAASAHDRGHGCAQAQPEHAAQPHLQLQAFRCLAQTLARYGNARRGARISAAPDRGRDEHLQPQSDHDRGAVLVPRHAPSPRSGGRGLAHQGAREVAAGAEP